VENKYYTKDEVALHNNDEDCWIIIKNKVYNITDYLDKHRGGKMLLLYYGGKDATTEFNRLNHTKKAQKILESYYIGDLEEEKKSCVIGCNIQ
jgi:cytochrome b involved in lipid metabolism